MRVYLDSSYPEHVALLVSLCHAVVDFHVCNHVLRELRRALSGDWAVPQSETLATEELASHLIQMVDASAVQTVKNINCL